MKNLPERGRSLPKALGWMGGWGDEELREASVGSQSHGSGPGEAARGGRGWCPEGAKLTVL